MKEHGMYFGKREFYETIRSNGGEWNDSKERPYMNLSSSDIRSCFYHLGSTDKQSIFFISDVVPITDKYIEREYIGCHTEKIYIIKNKVLLSELNRKLSRILAWENVHNNFFRQHITDLKNYLLNEL